MMSLKAFAPILASIVGTTPAAIYERQRALVRAKLLPTPVGRGRGNGLPATADTVAMLLIAIMVTDNLSDTDGRVGKLAHAQVVGRGPLKRQKARCGLTGRRDFKGALIAILRSTEFPTSLVVEVSRNNLAASIIYGRRPRENSDCVGITKFRGSPPVGSKLSVEATLGLEAIEIISKALHSESQESSDERFYP